MYAKLFASLYQGTLRGKSNEILVFTNMLAHCDKEGFVDMHFRAIADETGLSEEEVRKAAEELEKPDEESRSHELEGRRIVRIDDHRAWGWRVVNFLKYRAIRDEDARRETWRKAQEKRRCGRSTMSTTVNHGHPPSTQTDTYTDISKKETPRANAFPSREQVLSYAKSAPMPISDESAIAFFDHQEAQGWRMANGNPITNWQAALRRWASIGNEREKSKPVAKRRSTDPMPGEVCELI